MAANRRTFQDVCFFIMDNSVKNQAEVKQLLRLGGGIQETFTSDLVTHIITDCKVVDRGDVAGSDCDAVIVNSDWVLLSSKCGTTLPTTPFDMTVEKLFDGLVFCPSQLCSTDREKLWALTIYHGGRMQGRLDSHITHLVALHAKGEKYEQARQHSVAIVTPFWVLDCIDQGKLLEEEEYCPLPPEQDDEVSLHVETVSVTTLPTHEGTFSDNGETDCTDQQTKAIEPLSENVVHINGDEEQETSTARHELVSPVFDMPVVIRPLIREDSESIRSPSEDALSPSESNGSLAVSDEKQGSTRNLDKIGKSGWKEEENQDGEELEPSSTPPQILQGLVLCVVDYPKLMEPGTMAKWTEVVERHGGKMVEEYNSETVTHLLAQNKGNQFFSKAFADSKCIISAHWLNDVLVELKMFPPRYPLHFPIATETSPDRCKQLSVALTNYVGSERELVRDMIRITGVPYTGFLSRRTTHLICKRGEGRKYEKAKEWGVQVVNSTFIADIIHNGQVPSVLFPKHTELGRADEFNVSCFEAIRLLKPWQQFIAKYSSQHPEWVEQETCDNCFASLLPTRGPLWSPMGGAPPPRKKAKLEDGTSQECDNEEPQPCIMFTGLTLSAVRKLKQLLQQLRGALTADPHECTHLIAPRIARTVKFLSSISVSQYIVRPEWLEHSAQTGHFIGETPYILRDPQAEEMFQMTIPSSLERARAGKLLSGYIFHATSNVNPSFDHLQLIVECAGGELLNKVDLVARFGRKLDLNGSQLLILSCAEDVEAGLCDEYFSQDIAVYNVEFMLTGVLRQALDFTQNRISVPVDQPSTHIT